MTTGFQLKQNINALERCPQCGVAKPSLVLHGVLGDPLTNSSNEPLWFSYRCTSCSALIGIQANAVLSQVSQHPGSYLSSRPTFAISIIPNPETIDQDLPEKPRRYLEQAMASLHVPDGAVMLAGSAIDAMLKLKGYVDGAVYSRIEQAVKDHVLTPDMSKWAHAVRLESNKPRHADLEEPHATREIAETTIDFAKALGDFLFVFPARIHRGMAKAEESSSSDVA